MVHYWHRPVIYWLCVSTTSLPITEVEIRDCDNKDNRIIILLRHIAMAKLGDLQSLDISCLITDDETEYLVRVLKSAFNFNIKHTRVRLFCKRAV